MATAFNETHIHALTKERIREIYEIEIENFFKRKIVLLNMGGSELQQEKNLNLKGLLKEAISVEKQKNYYKLAVKNAPSNVAVLRGSIFDYLTTGEEDAIILDSVNGFVDSSLMEFFKFFSNNKIVKKTIVILNLVEHLRNGKNLTIENEYSNDYKRNGFVQQMSYYLINNRVNLTENPRIIEYKNKNMGTPMISYIFKLDVAA